MAEVEQLVSAQRYQQAQQLLCELSKAVVTAEAVKEGGAGKRLTALTKHGRADVAAAAGECISAWKAQLARTLSGQPR